MRDAYSIGMARAERYGEVEGVVAGRYALEHLLGRGGMSAVYSAHDLLTGRKLAVKRSLASSPRSALRQRELLEREFNTLTQLAHPCIIEVYDYGVDDDVRPYYTMELLDGADLHNTGVLPWQRACSLLRDVASSLAILHSRGLIHRDVSSRNVRCTAQGRAKLIDFGAMSSLGIAQDVVGTPPFLAPEVLQMQALDGRADLFSLGALAYYLLTGRHAFPARKLQDLRDVWRSTPQPPLRFQPDMPPALNALVLQLLSLDRSARAYTAPDVMTRLCTLAGLPITEQVQVSRAYLTTPSLVGRESELVTVRKRMLSLARGDGGTLLIQGVSGSGRSRMLEACALEAKLVGAQVLRVGADRERSPFSAVRALGAQLLQLMPEQAREAARLAQDVLGQVVEGLRADSAVSCTQPSDRNLVIREFRDFVLNLAREQRLVIVVDDAERIDEPSAALLAALAYKTERHPLLLALSLDSERKRNATASLRLLHLVAQPIELQQLDRLQTEALVSSLFGGAKNAPLIAAKIHALSHGNPRAIMELAQHLVERGLSRYESGSWWLPEDLSERDLPGTLSASLAARIAPLSAAAREICAALCLADGDGAALSIERCAALCAPLEPRRVFAAFDELIAARVLARDAEHHHFTQRGFLAVIEQGMSPERRHKLHGRLADALAEHGADVVRRAHHLMQAGRAREAVELLISIDLTRAAPPAELLESAIAYALEHALPARSVHVLRRALVVMAPTTMAFESYLRHAPFVFAQLARDSGYDRYQQLAHVPESERLAQALAYAQAQYEATPEAERVYGVFEAIQQFTLLLTAARAMGVLMLDLEFVERLPSLAPFANLSPALPLLILAGDSTSEWLHGRFARTHEVYAEVLARLDAPGHGNLSESDYVRFKMSIHYGLGVLEASRGVATAEVHAQILDGAREFRVNAWRVRRLLHLSRGDLQEANKCERRAELLQLQDGIEAAYAGTSVLGELALFALIGDVLAIRNALDSIADLAERSPGWRPFRIYGQASSQLLQGDAAAALQTLLPGLELARPGRHPAFGFLAGLHVEVLCELGECAQARELGLAYLELSEREEITTTGQLVQLAAARALALCGEAERGAALLDGVIALAEARGQSGVSIGVMYEARARCAIKLNDAHGFEHFAARCASEYRKGNNPFLAAKCARLLAEARGAELESAPQVAPLMAAAQPVDSAYLTIQSRMLECIDRDDRARCALTMLLQQIESFAGFLFGVDEGEPLLLAALPEDGARPEPELLRWLQQYISAQASANDDITRDLHEERTQEGGGPGFASKYVARDGRRYEPLSLSCEYGAEPRLAAVLLHRIEEVARFPESQLKQQIALQLLEHGDVSGMLLPEPLVTRTRTG